MALQMELHGMQVRTLALSYYLRFKAKFAIFSNGWNARLELYGSWML